MTRIESKIRYGVALAIGLAFIASGARAQDELKRQAAAASASIRATIRADGSYQIALRGVDWRLEGKLPAAAATIRRSRGKDQVGEYQSISAAYLNGGRNAEIRVYQNVPGVLLEDMYVSAGANENPFPTFAALPPDLMKFSYQRKEFGDYEFGALGTEGPWSLFDKDGHVLLISPADHFQVSHMDESDEGTAESRIVPSIQTLPGGFSHGTLIVWGTGMNRTFETWGNALLALGGKERPANDANVLLAKFGYWTDRGAFYYYHFDERLGYAGTLLALRDEFQKLGLPLGYMQLDSWWYPKGDDDRWNSGGSTLAYGEDTYRADKELFPNGLAAFHQALGLPMVTHARWVSTSSPYRKQYKMSGNVVIDPAFWNSTADYLADAGVVTYEQDWLNENAQPEMNLSDPQAFLGDMSEAMGDKNITIQYCMPLPSDYMASTLYRNVQTTRVSDDRFERERWDSFLYDSRLASAVGLWPWTDVFFSGELPNLIISTLSAGPVGVGDALGGTNARNIAAVVRRDMVIVKPDTPLLPIDAMYAADATDPGKPMVAMATTAFGSDTVRYVFAYPRHREDQTVTVPLSELSVSGPVFAYDWMKHAGTLVPSGGNLAMKFDHGWDYQILSPVNRKGLALVGDTANFVAMGKKRIAAVDDRGTLTATIRFAPGEDTVPISGYAADRPKVKTAKGSANNFAYDSQTRMFELNVSPGKSGEAVLRISAR
ncbi:MAG TPA: hypothetical protein VMF66_08540 [Candidatus Acidoferrum sp.]|nr:hypothetical protein [Candidatus Acidoferrum sp.]